MSLALIKRRYETSRHIIIITLDGEPVSEMHMSDAEAIREFDRVVKTISNKPLKYSDEEIASVDITKEQYWDFIKRKDKRI